MRWLMLILVAAMLAGPMADLIQIGLFDHAAPSSVFGQEEEAQRGFTWWDALKAGGVIGIIIGLISIASLALIIQYAVEQKHDKLLPPHLTVELEQLFEEQAFDEAADMCQAEDNYLTRIVGAGLEKMEGGYDAIMKAVDVAGDEETTKLFQKLSNLSMIAGVAPMLGLFGTVSGMISAFIVIASTAGGASPAQLALGISEALVTTFLGLIVAIPTSVCYHFLRNRAITVSIEAASLVSSLFERFRAPQA